VIQRGQCCATGGKLVPGGVAQSRTQCLQHPGSAVGAGAATHPEDDLGAAPVQRSADQLTGSAAGGAERVRAATGQRRQAGGHRHLDHGGRPAHGDRSLDQLPGGPGDRHRDPGEAGRHCGVHRAIAPVGDRHGDRAQTGLRSLQPGLHMHRDFEGAECPLELVGGDQHVPARHNGSLFLVSRAWRSRSGRARPESPAPRTR